MTIRVYFNKSLFFGACVNNIKHFIFLEKPFLVQTFKILIQSWNTTATLYILFVSGYGHGCNRYTKVFFTMLVEAWPFRMHVSIVPFWGSPPPKTSALFIGPMLKHKHKHNHHHNLESVYRQKLWIFISFILCCINCLVNSYLVPRD